MGDHVGQFLPFGGSAPMLALADAAAATTDLRVGTAMLANDYRHPLLVAREAATIDVLSGGRFELGLGAGWLESDYRSLGIAFDSASIRIDRLSEAVRLIKLGWAGEPFDYSGVHYSVQNYRGLPQPIQHPHPPVVIGGGTPRILRLAGGLADIVGVHVSTRSTGSERIREVSEERLLEKLGWIRAGAGERYSALELQMTVFNLLVSRDPVEALRRSAEEKGVAEEEIANSVMSLVGTVDGICDELRRRRDRWGVSYVTVDSSLCDAFAPVVQRLSGS
jgi:probable F420-dependent oxidoreductase